jgi:hypothetical protein
MTDIRGNFGNSKLYFSLEWISIDLMFPKVNFKRFHVSWKWISINLIFRQSEFHLILRSPEWVWSFWCHALQITCHLLVKNNKQTIKENIQTNANQNKKRKLKPKKKTPKIINGHIMNFFVSKCPLSHACQDLYSYQRIFFDTG